MGNFFYQEAQYGRGFAFVETDDDLHLYLATDVGLYKIDGRSAWPDDVLYQTIQVPQCERMTDVGALEDGTLVVTCVDNARLVKVDPGTASVVEDFVCCEGAPAGFDPYAIAVAPSGLILAGTTQISTFDPSSGDFLDVAVEAGVEGATSYDDFIFGPNGNLFVSANPDIGVLEFDGDTFEFLGVFVAGGAHCVSTPTALAFSVEGDLLLVHLNGEILSQFDGETGQFVAVLEDLERSRSAILFVAVRP